MFYYQHAYAITMLRNMLDISSIHRLEFFSFLPLDGFECVVEVLFFLEVVSEENCFGEDPVLDFLNIFQFALSSKEIALPLCEL